MGQNFKNTSFGIVPYACNFKNICIRINPYGHNFAGMTTGIRAETQNPDKINNELLLLFCI